MAGEQPFIADIQALPTPSDACLVCTNVRLPGGKKPSYIDHSDSWFLFPLLHIRFIEIPADPAQRQDAPLLPAGVGADGDGLGELELDEDFLRRVREA